MKLKFALVACLMTALVATANDAPSIKQKLNANEALQALVSGNQRFVAGKRLHNHTDSARIILAANANQADHAYATILSCSDSRVPVEILFDAGIMDLFIIRVAGNEFSIPQVGSFEYGAFHVNTPLIVVLGHTQCGAVTAVTDAICGHGHELEENIPATVQPIVPCVKKVVENNPNAPRAELLNKATEENVKTTIYNSLVKSPALREGVKTGKIQIVGAIYELETGKVRFMPNTCLKTCEEAEKDTQCLQRAKK